MTQVRPGFETRSIPPIEELLRGRGRALEKDAAAAFWRACRLCTHLMAEGAERDPWTGRVQVQRLSTALADLSRAIDAETPACEADALVRLAAHCADALHDIARQPRLKLAHKHELLPLHRVRDVDTTTMAWLSRQPGESIPEKLGRQQRALVPVRRPELDLPENRLVGHVARTLWRLLELRLADEPPLDASASEHDFARHRALLRARGSCLAAMRAGFAALSAQPVGRANNTLLADRNYRRLWQAWTWLGHLDRDLERSWNMARERFAELGLWALFAEMQSRVGVIGEDCFVTREAGFGGETFGIHAPSAETLVVSLYTTLYRRVEAVRSLILLRRDADQILIDRHELSAERDLLAVLPPTRFRVTLIPDLESAAPSLPVPLRAQVIPNGAQPEELGAAYANAEGWQNIATVLTKRLLGDDAQRRPAPSPPVEAVLVGLDPSAVVPRVVADTAPVFCRNLLAVGVYRDNHRRWRTDAVVDRPFAVLPDGGIWTSAPTLLAGLGSKQAPPAGAVETLTFLFGKLWATNLATAPMGAPTSRRSIAIATSALLPDPAQRWLRRTAVTGGEFSHSWLVERATAAALGWQLDPRFPHGHVRAGSRILVIDAEAGELRISTLRAAARTEAEGGGALYWVRDMADAPPPTSAIVTGRYWLRRYLHHALYPARRAGLLSAEDSEVITERLIEQGEAQRLLDHGGVVHLPLPAGSFPPRSVLQLTFDYATAEQAAGDWCAEYEDWLNRHADMLASCLDEWSGRTRRVLWNVLYVGSPFHQAAVRNRLQSTWRSVEAACHGRHAFYHHHLPVANWLVVSGCGEFLARQYADPPRPSWQDLPLEQFLETELEEGMTRVRIVSRQPRSPGEQVTDVIEGLVLPAGEERYLLPVLRGSGEQASYAHCALLRPPGFPLTQDQKVRLRVEYRYGEDDYRLFVEPEVPEGVAKPPFETVEAQWISMLNTPPRFRIPDARLDYWRARAVTALTRSAQQLGLEEAELMRLRASFEGSTSLETASEIWLPALSAMLTEMRSDARNAMVAIAHCVVALGGVPSPEVLTKLTLALDDRDPRIVNDALRVLRAVLRDPHAGHQVAALRRTVETAETRDLAVSNQIPVRAGRLPRFEWMTVPLGAIATVLLNEDGFLAILDTARLVCLRGICRRKLEQMSQVLAGSKVDADYVDWCFDTFRAICELLAGLLQIRGMAGERPEQAALFEVGDARMHEMSRLLARVDGLLIRLQRELGGRPPRSQISVEVTGRRGMWPLSRLLFELLAGYAPQRLIGLATDQDDAPDE